VKFPNAAIDVDRWPPRRTPERPCGPFGLDSASR
jgi:hypothetical protein